MYCEASLASSAVVSVCVCVCLFSSSATLNDERLEEEELQLLIKWADDDGGDLQICLRVLHLLVSVLCRLGGGVWGSGV